MISHDPARPGADDDLAATQLRAFVAALTGLLARGAALSEAEGRAGAAALSHELSQLIELHSLEASRVGGRSSIDTHLQARYLKAALADEMLLHTDWAGRAHWHHVLIEANLFGSAHAGQKVFDDIDALLRQREATRRPDARLYLLLLAFGFQGRYRGSANLDLIAGYRRDLFGLAHGRAPGQGGPDAVLSQQPYASTLASTPGARLGKASRRSALLALSLVALLALSEVLWLWQSWPLRQALAPQALAGQRGPA